MAASISLLDFLALKTQLNRLFKYTVFLYFYGMLLLGLFGFPRLITPQAKAGTK
jgi:hypothetical protein